MSACPEDPPPIAIPSLFPNKKSDGTLSASFRTEAAAAAAASTFLEAEVLRLELKRRTNDFRRLFLDDGMMDDGGDVDDGGVSCCLCCSSGGGEDEKGDGGGDEKGEGDDLGCCSPRLACLFGRTGAELVRSKFEVARLGRAPGVLPCANQNGVGVDPRDEADSDEP